MNGPTLTVDPWSRRAQATDRLLGPVRSGLLLLFLLLVLVAAAGAPAAAVPLDLLHLDASVSGEFVSVQAPNEEQAAEVLSMAQEAWRLLDPHFDATPPEQVKIYVLQDQEYELLEPAPMTRGFATFGGNRIYLRASQADQEVVTHELVHIFLGHTVRPGIEIPDWFNEGLAQYASGAKTQTLALIFEASAGNLLSLSELKRIDSLNDANRQLASTQGLAVVRFLVSEFGEEKLWELVDNLSVARTFEQALFVTYGYTDLEMDHQWSAFAADAYSLVSPVALRLLLSAFLAALSLLAAAVWLLRRWTRLHTGPEPALSQAEIEAARRAEALMPLGGADPATFEPFDDADSGSSRRQ
ncbi:MAG: hypothetical protein Kow00129_08680 [Thermoleophilia bacterium]